MMDCKWFTEPVVKPFKEEEHKIEPKWINNFLADSAVVLFATAFAMVVLGNILE